LKAPEVSHEIFGGIFDYDGGGMYPGLELLSLVFGANSKGILPLEEEIEFIKQSQHFARRLVWDYERLKQESDYKNTFVEEHTGEVVRNLLSCLQVPIPNISKAPSWERAHFFPYCQALIHWDARKRGAKYNIERRYYRGGGALAHKVLRLDKDHERLQEIRKGLENLYKTNDYSALQKLAGVMREQGLESPPLKDTKEVQSQLRDSETDDILREGVRNITSHTELSCATRIKALLNWTAFWLVIVQTKRSASYLGKEALPIIVDCGSTPGQLRRASTRRHNEIRAMIGNAVDKCTKNYEKDKLSRKKWHKIQGFLTVNCATIGLLNAFKGKRHFTLGIGLLETLVLAATYRNNEISFDRFSNDLLYKKWNLVVGRPSAELAGLLIMFDASIFEDNEEQLSNQMKAAGLITDYSDATRMVSTKGLT